VHIYFLQLLAKLTSPHFDPQGAMSMDRITLFFFPRDMTWVKSEEQKAIDAEQNDQIILELLLRQSKTKLNARNLTGKTPFTAAMEASQIAWAEKIAQAGDNPDVDKVRWRFLVGHLSFEGNGEEGQVAAREVARYGPLPEL
jgi:hypothetical protein